MSYLPRILDTALRSALDGLPAVAIDGAKGVGKSATAERVARSVLRLDRPEELMILQADRDRIDRLERPVLIDEWQQDPPIWDAVRRSVDADRSPGRFILTGSANPRDAKIHSGAGRIVRMRMRPLSFAERQRDQPTVSLRSLLVGDAGVIEGTTSIGLEDYVTEMLGSGFPGIRTSAESTHATQLDSYLSYALSHEVPALGAVVRRPLALEAWLRAYAAASSTTASFESIADAVSREVRPTRATIGDYREALTQLWLLDEVPGWVPTGNEINRLGQAPKHQLADPALAARLLRANREALLNATSQADRSETYQRLRKGPMLGSLFESLVTLSVRVYAQPVAGHVSHLRTHSGDHEVDLIVEAPDGRVLAIEVKLAATINDHDVRHLNWLQTKITDDLVDRVIVSTGP
ncbi:MAG: ATP-binding protein [Candidatus Nanopelagicales bacterium]